MNENATVEKQIEEVLAELSKNTPGTESYTKLSQNLATLQKVENEKAETEASIEQKYQMAETERVKAENDTYVAMERVKATKREAFCGVLKTGLSLVAALGLGLFAYIGDKENIANKNIWNISSKILHL